MATDTATTSSLGSPLNVDDCELLLGNDAFDTDEDLGILEEENEEWLPDDIDFGFETTPVGPSLRAAVPFPMTTKSPNGGATKAGSQPKKRKQSGDALIIAKATEETLKELEIDPNSAEGKKKKRQIRNRMSAQIHRDRKNGHITELENQVKALNAQLEHAHKELYILNHENSYLKSLLPPSVVVPTIAMGPAPMSEHSQGFGSTSMVSGSFSAHSSSGNTDSDGETQITVNSSSNFSSSNSKSSPSIGQSASPTSMPHGITLPPASKPPLSLSRSMMQHQLPNQFAAAIQAHQQMKDQQMKHSMDTLLTQLTAELPSSSSCRNNCNSSAVGAAPIASACTTGQMDDSHSSKRARPAAVPATGVPSSAGGIYASHPMTRSLSFVAMLCVIGMVLLQSQNKSILDLAQQTSQAAPDSSSLFEPQKSVLHRRLSTIPDYEASEQRSESQSKIHRAALPMLPTSSAHHFSPENMGNRSVLAGERPVSGAATGRHLRGRHMLPSASDDQDKSRMNSSYFPGATEDSSDSPGEAAASWSLLPYTLHTPFLPRGSAGSDLQGGYDYTVNSYSSVVMTQGRALLDPRIGVTGSSSGKSPVAPRTTAASHATAAAASPSSSALVQSSSLPNHALGAATPPAPAPAASSASLSILQLPSLGADRGSSAQASAPSSPPRSSMDQQSAYYKQLMANSNILTIQLPASMVRMGSSWSNAEQGLAAESIVSALNLHSQQTGYKDSPHHSGSSNHKGVIEEGDVNDEIVSSVLRYSPSSLHEEDRSYNTSVDKDIGESSKDDGALYVSALELNCMILGAKMTMVPPVTHSSTSGQ